MRLTELATGEDRALAVETVHLINACTSVLARHGQAFVDVRARDTITSIPRLARASKRAIRVGTVGVGVTVVGPSGTLVDVDTRAR